MDVDATRPLQAEPEPTERVPGGPQVGTLIGRYVLLGVLGRGGEGEVYEAFDTELERKVALKLLRGGSPTVAARREARAQAKLDHPAVVSIFDVGDADGHAYIAMELMDAGGFEAWAASASPAEVLAALRQVASGIEAAHAAGLVHGDIKPTNILRSLRGEPKLSDFGVARAAPKPEHPEQAGLAGTRAFMAPELFEGAAAGPRSDQYAFCVTAWQVLHGKHPSAAHASRAATLHGRNAGSGGGSEGSTDGGAEQTGEQVSPPGELPPWTAPGVPRAVRDAIVRGLDPDPQKRWPSMGELRAAMRPLPSRGRWVALGIPALALATAAGLSFGGMQAPDPCQSSGEAVERVWSEAARDAVSTALQAPGYGAVQQRALEALDGWSAAWREDVQDSCRATHVEHTQSPDLLDLRGACYREALAGFEASVDVLAQTDDVSRPHAHTVVLGLPELADCDDIATLKFGPLLDDATQARVEAARAEVVRAGALRRAGRGHAGLEALDAVQPEIDALDLPRLRLQALLERAEGEATIMDKHAAVEHAQQALALSLTHDEHFVLDDVLMLLTSLLGHDVGMGDQAAVYAAMLEARTQREGVEGGDLAALVAALAMQQVGQGAYDEAIATFERALALRAADRGEDSEYTSILSGLAMAQSYAGRSDAALASFEHVLEVRKRLFGEDHPLLSHTLDGIALELRQRGDFEQALQVAETSLRILQSSAPAGHDALSSNANGRAQALAHLGRTQEARDAFEEALAHAELAYPGGSRGVAILRMNLAKFIAEEFGDHEEAVDLAAAAVRQHAQAVGPKHAELVVARAHYGQLLGLAGRVDAGRDEIEQAIALGREVLPPGHPDVAYARLRLAQLELRAGRWDEAERVAAAVERDLQADPAGPPSLRETATHILELARAERAE